MRGWLVAGVALTMASTAFAAPNIANVSQKGSVLVFPDIVATGTWNTLVRVSNDGPISIHVKCYWMDGKKNRLDLSFSLTPFQPAWFDARTGDGSTSVTPFPSVPSNGIGDPTGTGVLVCWATDIEETVQLKYNHLYGSALVVGNARAYEYSAYAFYAQVPGANGTTVIGSGGDIQLNGFYYDQCPEYQTGGFTPSGAQVDGVRVTGTRLVFASCTLDLTQDWAMLYTKIVFDVWNDYDNKFTGAFDCSDSWHETYLAGQQGGSVFTGPSLGTPGARFRAAGVASTRCGTADGPAIKVGLLGVQVTATNAGVVASTLTNAGKIPGRIRWDPGAPTPDGGIR